MNTFLMKYKMMKENVKMSSTWGQSAWFKSYKKYVFGPSETTRSAFYSMLAKNSPENVFHQWLVGIVDGDGCFYFGKTKKGTWTFCFKVGQSQYNLRVLYFMKKMLGVGHITVPSKASSCAEYRIRNMIHLKEKILPIFDKYPLLTSKQFVYETFRESLLVYLDNNLSKDEKEKLLVYNKSKKTPTNYISFVWKGINEEFLSVDQVQSIMSKYWVVGFTEAEGSFYLTKKGPFRISHCFEITQKNDKIVLKGISLLLDMKVMSKGTYFTCITTTQASVNKVIYYFFHTIKGMKSLEYRIWSRSFRKKNSFEELVKIQKIMNNIRNKISTSYTNKLCKHIIKWRYSPIQYENIGIYLVRLNIVKKVIHHWQDYKVTQEVQLI